MKSPGSYVFPVLFSLLVGPILGCGKSDWGYVTGTIKLNGAPIGPGTIMFEPLVRESNALSGFDEFDEDGAYDIRSAGGREGIPPGEYSIIIDGQAKESAGDEFVDPMQKSKIPAKYLNAQASGLKAVVTAGDNSIDFDLEP